MAGKSKLEDMSGEALLKAYVENVQVWEETERVSAANRLMDERQEIVAEFKRRDSSLSPLRTLLEHPDPDVRYSAAHKFRVTDHETFESTIRALVDLGGEIARKAESALRTDAHFQEVGYPELEKRTDLPPLSDSATWQARNPPPPAMDKSEIKKVLDEFLPEDIAFQIFGMIRPSIGLWPKKPPKKFDPHESRFGGLPHAPPGWSWPTIEDDEPLLFLAQMNCAHLKGLPGAQDLPSSGILAFFGDYDSVNGCEPHGDSAVYHWSETEKLELAAEPERLPERLVPAGMAFRPMLTLPPPYHQPVADILEPDEVWESYWDAYDAIRHHGIPEDSVMSSGFARLLGWHALVQWNDLDHFEHASETEDWNLLLQLDGYTNGTDAQVWGPDGSLYFLIHDNALNKQKFATCEFTNQMT